jgi:hypothetical protein
MHVNFDIVVVFIAVVFKEVNLEKLLLVVVSWIEYISS